VPADPHGSAGFFYREDAKEGTEGRKELATTRRVNNILHIHRHPSQFGGFTRDPSRLSLCLLRVFAVKKPRGAGSDRWL
jgi:hypothetical protein